MMKKILALATLVFVIGLAMAAVDIGNASDSLKNSYSEGSKITGWINISFEDALSNSVFKVYNKEVSLIEILNSNLNKGLDYDCDPVNCKESYSDSNAQTTQTIELENGESVVYGIKLNGKISNINSISLNVKSDAGPSCLNQLSIDFFNDGVNDIRNTQSIEGSSCSITKTYGCYDGSVTTEFYSLGSTPFCQKVSLGESPGFKLGAWVKNVSGGKEVTMKLYNYAGEEVKNGSCKLSGISSEGGEVECDVNATATSTNNHYICITGQGNGEVQIKGYSSTNANLTCGFYGSAPKSSTPAAYQIYAEGKRFNSFGEATINDKTVNGEKLSSLATNYLRKNYGSGIDCSGDCIIPFEITAYDDQTLTIERLEVEYEKDSGPTSTNLIYESSTEPVIINSEFIKIYLDDANFTVPSTKGNSTMIVYFENEEILRKRIAIEDVPGISYIYPTLTGAGVPTDFFVLANSSSGNITQYIWNFGDNKTATTTVNKATHTYNKTGIYSLTVKIKDSSQREYERSFSITVESPQAVINSTLSKKQTDLARIKTQIESLPEFYKKGIANSVDVDELNDQLKSVQTDYSRASTEQDYVNIVGKLVSLRVPQSINVETEVNSISYFPSDKIIDPTAASLSTGTNYDGSDKSRYVDAILAWDYENIDSRLTSKKIIATYDGNEELVLKIFELDIKEKETLNYNPTIVVKKMDNLTFKEDYFESEEDGYYYFDLDEDKVVSFYTTENVAFVDLAVFISPSLDRLSVSRRIKIIDPNGPNWILFSLIIFVLIVMGIIAYIVLQQWYKRNYENYLFKDRNNLYNIMSYIENSKKNGMDDKSIEIKLKKSGWNGEQVTYAMRKYAGKRTGMYELFKLNIKIKELTKSK